MLARDEAIELPVVSFLPTDTFPALDSLLYTLATGVPRIGCHTAVLMNQILLINNA